MNLVRGSYCHFQLIVALSLFLVFVNETQATIRYVRPTSYGSGNATSWANASADLQLQINQSNGSDTIFVAAGTYVPIRPFNRLTIIDSNNRENSYVLKADVQLFGGFPNTGTATWADRDWDAYPTILSGDIGIPNDSTDNCQHVVVSMGDVGTARIDGFTITKGYVDTNSIFINSIFSYIGYKGGSGMYNNWSSPTIANVVITRNTAISKRIGETTSGGFASGMVNVFASPVLINVVISGNSGISAGGAGVFGCGMYNNNSSPILTHVVISGNSITSVVGVNGHTMMGSGMYNYHSSPILTHVVISGNSVNGDSRGEGGGMYNNLSSPTLTHVVISGNNASGNAMGRGGGIYNGNNSSAILTNVIISGNNASGNTIAEGGGMWNEGTPPILTNVIISGNSTSSSVGSGICNYNYSVSSFFNTLNIRNSIIWGNIGTNVQTNVPINYQHCLVGGEPIGNGIILNFDPLFVDTANGNYRLDYCSPAIDAGNNAFYSSDSLPDLSSIRTDLDGNPRIYATVDLGAYEYQQPRFSGALIPDTAFILCYGEMTRIPFYFTGTPPWQFIYTKDNGITYDTIKSIWDSVFYWDVSHLETTTYKFVAVSDSNCVLTIMDTIEIKALPVPVFTNRFLNDTLCSGSKTQAVVFSGFASDFVWSLSGDTIEGIPADVQIGNFGEYLIENKKNVPLTSLITAVARYDIGNGKTCIGRDTTFSITVFPEPLLTTLLENDTLCDGERTKAVEFSGIANRYEWYATGAVSGFPSGVQMDNFGTYTVRNQTANSAQSVIIVTPIYTSEKNRCEGKSESFDIIVHPATRIHSFHPDSNIFICGAKEVRMEVEASGKDLVYQWYHNGKPLQDADNTYYVLPLVSQSNSGAYYVVVSSACGKVTSRSVTIGSDIEILVWEQSKDEIFVDNSSRYYRAFQWYRDGLPIAGATDDSYREKGGLHGCYSVELTLNDNYKNKLYSCQRCFDKTKKYIQIYPNPAPTGSEIKVRFHPLTDYIHFLSVELYDATGQQIWQRQIGKAEFEINTTHLASGVYVLRIHTEDYWQYEEKIIVY